jgi:AcrR family transcriptional regulator
MTYLAMPTANKHELRRRATRDALRAAGIARFGRDGYDATTIRDIAADAGVTERTFYRHFGSKEALLFHDYEHRLEFFRAALALRPEGESVFQAALIAVQAYPDDLEAVRQAALLRQSSLSASELARYLQLVRGTFASEIEAFARRHFAGRPDGELMAAVAGNSIAGALVATFEIWGAGGAVEDMRVMCHRALSYVARGFDEPLPEPVPADVVPTELPT